ncbi:MAG: YbaY family lipoprotein [Roseiflexaceae bacterium]|nr:YbaY family lipoprotein [Roseiflexaceae bacterium]
MVDVSRQDVAGTLVAEQQIPANGKSSPIPFTMSVESSKIVDSNSYAVQATISTYGQNTFRSTNSYLVLTQGRPTTAELW